MPAVQEGLPACAIAMCSVLSAHSHLIASALQTTRRQQARRESRLGKRKASEPAASADASKPGTAEPPSSAPSRSRGRAAPQQQRTQASEPQALLGRRVRKHFEEGWFEVSDFSWHAGSTSTSSPQDAFALRTCNKAQTGRRP